MNKKDVKNPGSKPVKWNSERPKMAYQLALLGATDVMIAEAFEVDIETINNWKRTKPEFLQELYRGKIKADMKVVENLFLNCIDRWIEEEEVHILKGGLVRKIKVKKFHKGNWQAQTRWLALRQRMDWSETQRLEITNTNVNINKLDLEGITTEQLKVLRDIGLKQLCTTTDAGNN